MNKNPFKSMIKSIVRTLWKYFLSPIFVKPLPNSKPKKKLLNIGYRIEHRLWWPKTPKSSQYIPYIDSINIDPYLLQELSELGKIEFDIQPTPYLLSNIQYNLYQPSTKLEHNSLGYTYGLIIRHLKNLNYDIIFLVPWLARGGADLGLLHHINAMYEKGYQILLITTENAESPWINKLPKGVQYLDFGKFTTTLPFDKRIELLARVLIQSTAQTIHNINSRDGWEVYKSFSIQLTSMKKQLFASVFSQEQITENTYFGYSPAYIPSTYHSLSKVFCDTSWYTKEQIQQTGLTQLFQVLYFPFLNNLQPYRKPIENSAPILWASRLAPEKLPQLLYKIAQAFPEQIFHIYGEATPSCKCDVENLKKLPNIQYFGKYESFHEIATKNNYKAFLYTTKFDGMPNVLIEAISNGLPVIAYDVGGISELIHSDCLLNHSDSFESNLDKIKNILSDECLLKSTWQYSHDILISRHSWNHFISSLESINGYFPKVTSEEYKTKYYENMRVLSKPSS